jgi:hypothetical protein
MKVGSRTTLGDAHRRPGETNPEHPATATGEQTTRHGGPKRGRDAAMEPVLSLCYPSDGVPIDQRWAAWKAAMTVRLKG